MQHLTVPVTVGVIQPLHSSRLCFSVATKTHHFVAGQEVGPVQRHQDLGVRQVLLRLDQLLQAVANGLGHEGRRDRDVGQVPAMSCRFYYHERIVTARAPGEGVVLRMTMKGWHAV